MKRVLLFLVLGFLTLSFKALAADELTLRIGSIEERVKKIEASQQDIITGQQKILAELENLRVWIARR